MGKVTCLAAASHTWRRAGCTRSPAWKRIVPIRELIDALCQISCDHQIDWEISHDYHDGPVGYIRSGSADDKLVAEIDRLLAEFEAFREGKEPWA